MLKYLFFGIGCILLFEGLFYFLISNKINNIFEIINSFDSQKIRNLSSILIILGLALIYFTFKVYKV